MLLITGITGHSGRYFLKELIENKYENKIRCVVRVGSDVSILENTNLDIELVIGELTDQDFLDGIMLGVDEVIHIASIFYSQNIVRAAVKQSVERVTLVHTTGIYSKHKSATEEYKEIENKINEILDESNSSINVIYLRPTMIYGYLNDRNMIVFIKMVDKFRLFPVVANGQSLLQPVNGRDLGKAYYQILTKKEIIAGDYILSGERPISMLEMFKIISEHLHKKTMFLNIPLKLAIFSAKCLKLVTFNKVDYIEKVQRMGEDRNFPHDMAKKDFGYNPMSFEEGLKIEVLEYLNSKN